MDDMLKILEDIQPDVNYETCTTLIDDHILTSLMIISLISELEDVFDVSIPAVQITPKNFNSANAIWKMIQNLRDN